MADKNILFGKNCTPITPEKCHPHFPGNSPLEIEILSSPPPLPPLFENLLEG